MELSKFHGIPWNFPFDLEKFHGIPWNFWRVPWNSMELWNIDINKFHNWGSVFHCFLYDFMSLYIRQSISSWNIEIFQFQSNFLVPLILVKWRYSILNGGLLEPYCITLMTHYATTRERKLPQSYFYLLHCFNIIRCNSFGLMKQQCINSCNHLINTLTEAWTFMPTLFRDFRCVFLRKHICILIWI